MKQKIFILITPIIALAVTLWQQVRARTVNQTPWKGGGYGMFATNDHNSTRFTRIYVEVAGTQYPAEISKEARPWEEEFLAAPTFESIHVFAARLTQLKWRKPLGLKIIGENSLSPWLESELVTPDSMRVEYWRVFLDTDSAQLSLEKQFERHYNFSDVRG